MKIFDEEKLFEQKWNKMLLRIPERCRTADSWTPAITAQFLKKEESAVRKMVSEGKIWAFRNCGTLEVEVSTVRLHLRRQNGFED